MSMTESAADTNPHDPPATTASGPRGSGDAPAKKGRVSVIDRLDTRSTIALFLTFSFVLLVFVLAWKDVNGDVFKVLAGALSGVGFASVIGWYFNSTKGSEDKTALLAARDAQPRSGT